MNAKDWKVSVARDGRINVEFGRESKRLTAEEVYDFVEELVSVIVVGQVFSRPDGSRLRVDDVKKGQVYYVAWRPGQELGNPLRMSVSDFESAIRKESMVLEGQK